MQEKIKEGGDRKRHRGKYRGKKTGMDERERERI